MLLHEGVEAYKKEGPKFMQRLVAKQKARVRDPRPRRPAIRIDTRINSLL